MNRLHILVIQLLLLTVTVGAAVFLVASGEIELAPEPETPERAVETTDAPSGPDLGVVAVDSGVSEEEPPFDGPRLYLVLDDAGHSLDHLRRFIRFPGVFTLAVLPRLEYTHESARMAIASGHAVILHQPMEPLGEHDPGPGAIMVGDSEGRIRATLGRNIDSIAGITGINNHMGSKATGDQYTMEVVATELSRRSMFFLDSRTTPHTVAVPIARSIGVPVLERDVFLDNVADRELIGEQLDEALAIARDKGWAVMIGHVTVAELADVLIGRYEEIVAAGYRFFPLEDLLEYAADTSPRD